MLKEKLFSLTDRHPLIFQKVGLVAGAIAGLAVGLFITDRAEAFELMIEELAEEESEDGN